MAIDGPCFPMMPSDLSMKLDIIDTIITDSEKWIYEVMVYE